MSILIISDSDQRRIDEIVTHAREHFVPWSELQHGVVLDYSPELKLDDRVAGFERPASQHIHLGDFRVAFSFEEQPSGIVRHLSVSVKDGRKLPHPIAVERLCQAFGFKNFPPEDGGIWREEFDPGRWAINVAEVADPAAKAKLN